jgi:hypothetical protein
VRVNHHRSHILVPEQLLDRADVLPALQQMRREVVRQRRLAQSLAETAQDKAFVKTLAPDVRTALTEAVTAGEALDADHVLPPLLVDNSTDTVFGAFDALMRW